MLRISHSKPAWLLFTLIRCLICCYCILVPMRWQLHIMSRWRLPSFFRNLFKNLKMNRQNWLQNFMWCAKFLLNKTFQLLSLLLLCNAIIFVHLYLLSLSLSDTATYEIEWQGTFNAISSNIKVKSFNPSIFLFYFFCLELSFWNCKKF